jgi:hypothetical protein
MKRDSQTEYRRHQVYVPMRALRSVQEIISERQPVAVAAIAMVD